MSSGVLVTTANLAYCAGFVDGEGCVVVSLNGSVGVRVINTGLPSLKKLQEVLGGTIHPRKQRANKKQFYWAAYGEDAVKALLSMLPFMIEKAEQARLALDWHSTKDRYAPSRIPGKRGLFKHPERQAALDAVRRGLSQLKLEEHE